MVLNIFAFPIWLPMIIVKLFLSTKNFKFVHPKTCALIFFLHPNFCFCAPKNFLLCTNNFFVHQKNFCTLRVFFSWNYFLCNVYQNFFVHKNIFGVQKKIFAHLKSFSAQKLFFEHQNFFCAPKIFLPQKCFFVVQKFFLCTKKFFVHQKMFFATPKNCYGLPKNRFCAPKNHFCITKIIFF